MYSLQIHCTYTPLNLLQMELFAGRQKARYQRLTSADEKSARPKKHWMKKTNGRVKGFRLSKCKKLNWKAFSVILIPKRISRVYFDIVKRMKLDEVCPAIIFSCQWGLPVLSHSSVNCRKNFRTLTWLS
ncbi:Hypothetical predicted protein [Olea europaea subsp. europaea]|uniref:Uncharacterized protein n=1 Tax=Olea europaea subsp. europaea TaxID=158383 RepID=A0A8S0SL69_OLEEU|nr:Hypothetical predicted protein [Olea europaea subsp. europaea]